MKDMPGLKLFTKSKLCASTVAGFLDAHITWYLNGPIYIEENCWIIGKGRCGAKRCSK